MGTKMILKCSYCDGETELVTGEVIYPKIAPLHGKKYYLCRKCDAYVGCHGDTEMPFGSLANKELRKLRSMAHAVFDPMWMNKRKGRSAAYTWLAEKLGIAVGDCHIAMFGEATCRKVIELCTENETAYMYGVKPCLKNIK